MGEQLDLFGAPAPTAPKPAVVSLTCAFGEPWIGPHPLCEAETARACRAFDEAVARGEYNERGFTPREWAAYQRKLVTKANAAP